ncbi:MAG: DUF1223 domain-containing protein [Pyrinomonadaceae bacterium]
MKTQFFILAIVALLIFGACSFENGTVTAESNEGAKTETPTDAKGKTPVLVELFTSEGCSSCPPADELLERLETEQPYQNAEVITLSMHVDYWDRLGWKDPFSSALFSRRQDIYAGAFRTGQVYTPQMVVDGQTEFVGSDAAKATKAITENARMEKAVVEISLNKDQLAVKLSEVPKHENATVYLAFAEDDLANQVLRGENSGRKLTHTSVVRELKTLGMLPAEQDQLKLEQSVQIQPDWKRENLKLVVFIQENQSRKVLGVGRIKAV